MIGKKLLCEMSKSERIRFFKAENKLGMAKEARVGKPKGRKPKMLTYNGQTRPVIEWAAMYKINPWTLKTRIDLGWSGDDLFIGARKPRTPEQIAKDKVTIKLSQLRRKQERADHEFKVDMAVIKILKMRERRITRIDHISESREEMHYAIARVLEMRRRRAERMKIAA